MNLFKSDLSCIKSSLRSVHYLRSKLLIPSSIHHQSESSPKNKSNKNENKSLSCLILENNGFISDSVAGALTHLPLGELTKNILIA